MSEVRPLRLAPVSGFPEWLPQVRIVELRWLDHIRSAFERYGFCSIETPAAEPLEALQAKGETSQEVYVLQRLQGEGGDARLGLHFDLTVPLARYVAQHFNDLVFPFKRYQIQKSWRGERPQEGRFREFTQCDIDVIGSEYVSIHFDAEMPRILCEVLDGLGVEGYTMHVNNRKVLQGFYEAIGVPDPIDTIQIVDKLDKIGVGGVEAALRESGLGDDQVRSCLALAELRATDSGLADDIARISPSSNELLEKGLEELGFVLDQVRDLASEGKVVADLSIARGLNYYTGTVYEGKLDAFPSFGTICSGGRYDDLASSFIRRHLPGIGVSIGLTRLFSKMLAEGLIETGPLSPTKVLVALPSEELRPQAAETAARLRRRGLNVELYHEADKFGRQVRYASRKRIPYVWFPPTADGGRHEVKNLDSGDQLEADPESWAPA
ncbi:MAG TPA: histidine--tRNA ligase [Candidatus Dormibacteraeota bacterium]|jgi:histidyl-tRNA synthetase|nr:histidine--tRNA ligase [Candidatus Dormibacteraeota bacterium]